MDQHQRLIDRLELARRAAQAGNFHRTIAEFGQLLHHTIDHFATEERWMAAIGMPPDNAHAVQHREVLRLMRTVFRWCRDRARCDSLVLAIDELTEWFPLHTQVLDADLAQSMVRAGFAPVAE